MAQYLKINSNVLNADTIIGCYADLGSQTDIWIITTATGGTNSAQYGFWEIVTGSASERSALIIAINKALTSNPGGRVIEVFPSNDYTITSMEYVKFES